MSDPSIFEQTPKGKISINQIGSFEEQLDWAKRRILEKPSYKTKKKGADCVSQFERKAIVESLSVIETSLKKIMTQQSELNNITTKRLEFLEKLILKPSTSTTNPPILEGLSNGKRYEKENKQSNKTIFVANCTNRQTRTKGVKKNCRGDVNGF